ncbi:MAG: 6-bladed beta-propeller [Bacteroidales bacterium]|nr:6-bladed beta-propeller [Bacteroidales bacterium]
MRLKFVCLCFLVCLIFESCNKKESGTLPYKIDLTQNLEIEEIKLSDFVEDIDYVILENKNESYINWTYDLRANEKYIAVRDRFKILIYNWDGEIVSIVDNLGRGPGEYPSITDMEIGNDGESVLIFSWKSMYQYSIEDGSFIKKTELPGYVLECRSLDPEHYYFGIPAIWGQYQPAHIVVNNKMDTIHTIYNKFIFSSEEKFGTNDEVSSYSTLNGLFYKEFMDDTLFNISAEYGAVPYAVFYTGINRFTSEKRAENAEYNFNESWFTSGFFEVPEYLFIWLTRNEVSNLIAYNKIENIASLQEDWLLNDIDGGLPLRFAYIGNDSILVSSAPASDIISHNVDLQFSKSDNKFLKLKEIVNENDNHVLIIHRLKN